MKMIVIQMSRSSQKDFQQGSTIKIANVKVLTQKSCETDLHVSNQAGTF